MLNLKLFTSLQGKNNASLLLKPSTPGQVQFFVMSASVNYNIVVSGECEGELPTPTPMSFDVVLSSIVPLLDRNNEFKITYYGGTLRFVEINDKFSVEPLCVEHISDFAVDIAQRCLDTTELLEKHEQNKERRKEIEDRLHYLESNYKELKVLQLSGPPSEMPWGNVDDLDRTPLDEKYLPEIHKLEVELRTLNGAECLNEVNFTNMKRIASIAAKYNTVISMCDDYAIVALRNCYVLQKCKCGSRAIQGKLLQRLLQEEAGTFYEKDSELFFRGLAGKGKSRSETLVFLHPYLPNTQVGSSIITKGAVKEKYALTLKGMMSVVSAVVSKFDTMVFDMGKAELVLSNDRGEHLVHKFDMQDAKTLALNRMMRGEEVKSGELTMSCVEIPGEVQHILGLLRDDFTIYVKDRKVILQSGDLYVVFAR